MLEDLGQVVVRSPPSNSEVEIVGIQFRTPSKRDKDATIDAKQAKFDYDNIGNYVLVIKLRKDANTIRGSMPIDIRLRFINRHLGFFTPETQKMIIDYVKKYYPLVKEQEGIQRKIINSRRARIGRSNHRSNSSSRSASFRITT